MFSNDVFVEQLASQRHLFEGEYNRMELDEIELEVYRQHRVSQDKYAYFLLAAAGAAIAFSLNQTHSAALSRSHWSLAGAGLCWGLSFLGLSKLDLHRMHSVLKH